MEWQTIASLITLIGCAVSLGTILAKLVKVLTKLEITVSNQGDQLKSFKKDADEEHKHFEKELNAHDKKLQEHELRIHDLEREGNDGK